MTTYTSQALGALAAHAARWDNLLCLTSRRGEEGVFGALAPLPGGGLPPDGGEATLEEVRSALALLRGDRPIRLGSPWPHLRGGDPLAHPRFQEILADLRRRFPKTAVRIATDGAPLTHQLCRFLKDHGPVEVELLTLPLREEEREALLAPLILLVRYGIPFTGALVLPGGQEGEEWAETARLLARYGAEQVSVTAPGAGPEGLEALGEELPCPLLDPTRLPRDLEARTAGAWRDSPAWAAGLRRGDLLLQINGHAPISRLHAARLTGGRREIKVKYRRGDRLYTARWENGPRGSGLAFEADWDPEETAWLRQVLAQGEGEALLLLPRRRLPLAELALGELEGLALLPVEGETLGGPLWGRDLLCCRDFAAALGAYCRAHPAPGRVLLPAEHFNGLGLDLQGVGLAPFQRGVGIPVEAV